MIFKSKFPKWIFPTILVWAIGIMLMIPSFAETKTSAYKDLRLTVQSDCNVTITDEPNGWTISLYGKTDSGCDGSTTTSTVTATLTITNTATKDDGSVRRIDYKVTTTGCTSNLNKSDYTLDATTTSQVFTATSGKGEGNASSVTITFDSYTPESLGNSYETTFLTSAGGSYTVDGNSITESTIHTRKDDESYTLVAEPDSGYELYAWVSSGGVLKENEVNGSNTYSYTGKTALAIWPLFRKMETTNYPESAIYIIKDVSPAIPYSHLDEAIDAATAIGGTVVVYRPGTAYCSDPTKNEFVIPANVTLLIPYDSIYTVCTTKPTADVTYSTAVGVIPIATPKAWVTPSVFCSLTLPAEHRITVNGAISISGKVCANQVSNGCPTGPLGFVDMRTDSSITINNGGFLYAWGYIVGSGSVNVNSGGTVYENFQLKDWRGGEAASSMLDKGEMVFPCSQYYVQNVEVPMTFESGALEFGYMCLVAAKIFGETTVPFIGGTGMFRNEDDGTIVKDYIEETDRLEVTVNGDLTMSNLNLEISSYPMNSSSYVLPITNNLTVHVISGTTTIGQDMCMLPSSVITVAEGATVALAEGVNFFLYDADEWVGKSYVYSSRDVSPLAYVGANKGAPVARAALDDAKIIVNGTVDASLGYAYTTASGGNVTSTGSGTVIIGKIGSKDTTHQATQTGTAIAFDPISINTAWLKNANGTYVHSQADTYTYSLEQGRWLCSSEKHTDTDGNFVCDRCGTFLESYDLDMLFSFYATNVNLGNNLDMLFAMDQAKLSGGLGTADAPTYYAVFTRADHEAVIVPSNEWETLKIGGTDYYVVAYNGFAAKEMCDTVYVHIYRSSDDLRLSVCKNDGIRDYAVRLLKKVVADTDLEEQANLKRVIVDMLNYGAACQLHFGYKTDTLANDGLNDYQTYSTSGNPTVTAGAMPSGFWAGSNLITDSNISFAILLKDVNEKATITYSFRGHKGNNEPAEGKTVTLEKNGSYYYFVIPEVVVADAWCDITITVTYNGKTQTWTESIQAYVARNAKEGDVYMAYIKFAKSALTYLHDKNS